MLAIGTWKIYAEWGKLLASELKMLFTHVISSSLFFFSNTEHSIIVWQCTSHCQISIRNIKRVRYKEQHFISQRSAYKQSIIQGLAFTDCVHLRAYHGRRLKESRRREGGKKQKQILNSTFYETATPTITVALESAVYVDTNSHMRTSFIIQSPLIFVFMPKIVPSKIRITIYVFGKERMKL